MTYLIAGATGMLGHDIQQALAGREVTALSRADLDVTDAAAVAQAVAGHTFVINCAAYTNVDGAETDEGGAFMVNANGPANLATACAANEAKLVQISTDYVFNGIAAAPYAEETPPQPISAYGRTKAEGERLALDLNRSATYVVRTAWTYGAHGPNFAKTMLRLAEDNDELKVVNDQYGQPTWTMDVAHQIVKLLDEGHAPGVYHATSSGHTTWFEFAQEIFRASGLDPERILPTTSADFVRPAARPAYSVLGHERSTRCGLGVIRDWREALAEAVSQGVLSNA